MTPVRMVMEGLRAKGKYAPAREVGMKITYTRWFGAELTAENRKALYVPEGFAHGFITIRDNTEVLYQMSEFFHAECAAGVRWNDPLFSIDWPIDVTVISTRDESYNYLDIEVLR